VTVTVSHLEYADGLRVEYDGPGIPEAVRGNVLEAGNATSRSGHGLGLYTIEEVPFPKGEEGGAAFGTAGAGIPPEA